MVCIPVYAVCIDAAIVAACDKISCRAVYSTANFDQKLASAPMLYDEPTQWHNYAKLQRTSSPSLGEHSFSIHWLV